MTLYHEGVLCNGELIEATGLSGWTVCAATKDLEERDIISARPRLLDAWKTDYALSHAGGVFSSAATESVVP